MNTTLSLAVDNLSLLSETLEKVANESKYFNTDFGCYLEQISWEMYKLKNELRETAYMAGF